MTASIFLFESTEREQFRGGSAFSDGLWNKRTKDHSAVSSSHTEAHVSWSCFRGKIDLYTKPEIFQSEKYRPQTEGEWVVLGGSLYYNEHSPQNILLISIFQ